MSTDFSIRPVGIPAPAQFVTTSNSAANDAVQTDLPLSQTVTAGDASAAASNNGPGSDLPNNANVSRQIVFDQAAASFVFQVVNDKTEAVITQFPDEAMLRRRAYFHAIDLKSEPSRPLNTDLSA